MKREKANVLLANITWNPSGWRDNNYTNPKAGHGYARNNIAGESLNFKFNKSGVDDLLNIYGYFQWTNSPNWFIDSGLIFFYTRNTDENKGQIIGVYGNAEIQHNYEYHNFSNGEKYVSNLKAERDLSLLFPIPLDANLFKEKSSDRIVGQIGFAYKDLLFAKQILTAEILNLIEGESFEFELQKLLRLYEIYIGEKFIIPFRNSDQKEQQELENIFRNMAKKNLLEYINSLKDADSEKVIVKSKNYKRNNKTIVLIKILRDYKCQICSHTIIKKDGTKYIEAAHIKAKYLKGIEKPENIILLCPNHHKEFDLGNLIVIKQSDSEIEIKLNDKKYKLNLKF